MTPPVCKEGAKTAHRSRQFKPQLNFRPLSLLCPSLQKWEKHLEALGNKLGIERYGFCLPMDDCLAQIAIDFGGRNWLVWEADFQREMIGKMPTEMFYHFFNIDMPKQR